jgi:hypothetical protein
MPQGREGIADYVVAMAFVPVRFLARARTTVAWKFDIGRGLASRYRIELVSRARDGAVFAAFHLKS